MVVREEATGAATKLLGLALSWKDARTIVQRGFRRKLTCHEYLLKQVSLTAARQAGAWKAHAPAGGVLALVKGGTQELSWWLEKLFLDTGPFLRFFLISWLDLDFVAIL